ncbi:MAG: YiiX family permuted papain-like enzyme [Bacteroidota bacterium]
MIRHISFVTALFCMGLVVTSCQFQQPDPSTSGAQHEPPKEANATYHEGDILFQVSTSGQGKAIQIATNSAYSHCGLLFKEGDQWVVYEGVQPVKKTALAAWIVRGDHQHYVIKRHKEASRLLSAKNIEKMKAEARTHLGKNYDLTFEWSDDRIYCSELVYKVYQRGAGISLGTLQKLEEFNLKAPAVRQKLTERYGSQIPLNETVISPGSIFEDPTLRTIFRNHT